MPGIFGFVNKTAASVEANRDLIEAMQKQLRHNPDFESQIVVRDWCALGRAELPLDGEQRLLTSDSGPLAGFSGYIYDFRSLPDDSISTNNKATRLLASFKAHGTGFVSHLDGSYNAVVTDDESRTLYLANDRMGYRQMYLFEDDHVVMFSTEYKAFLAYDKFIRDLDWRGIANFFNYTYTLGDRTFFEHVKHLRGGTICSINRDGLKKERHWEFKFGEESQSSLPELVDEIDSLYADVMPKRVAGAKDIILPLSGGLDSRFLGAHVVKLGLQPHGFTHGVPGCSDYVIAKQLAKTLGLKNYTFIDANPEWYVDFHERFVWSTEGMVHAGPAMLMGIGSQYGLPAKSTVFLNGIFGGPTNFGSGYFRGYDVDAQLDDKALAQNLKRALFGETLGEAYFHKFAPDVRKLILDDYMPSALEEFERYKHVSPAYHNQKDIFFIRNRLTNFMNQVDCNRHLWHDHFALYDDKLVDFYLRLPAKYKVSRELFSEYFRVKLPDLAKVAYQATGVNLFQKPDPRRARQRARSKRRRYMLERLSFGLLKLYNLDDYYQFDQWYRSHRKLREFIEDLLLDKRTTDRGVFDRKGTEELLKRQRRGGNGFFEISAMTAFESFCRQFVDR